MPAGRSRWRGPSAPTCRFRAGGCAGGGTRARCSHLTQELQSQLDALSTHGIPRDKIFSEKISTRVRVRPQFEAALTLAREIKAHAPHCRVLFTVYEMKRLGRDAAELTALAGHLTAHGQVLEILDGPLPGIYDPSGPGRMLFGFFAAMAETEREARRGGCIRWCVRYADEGGLTATGRLRRETVRMQVAELFELFEQDVKPAEVARRPRASLKSATNGTSCGARAESRVTWRDLGLMANLGMPGTKLT